MADDKRIAYLKKEIRRSKDGKRKAGLQKLLDEAQAGGGASGGVPEPGPIQHSIQETTDILNAGRDWAANNTAVTLPDGSFKTINAATSPEMQALLTDTRDFTQGLRNLSPLELEALGLMRNSLAGYNAPEVQLMRDRALQALQGETATAMRAAQGMAARGGVRGAAGAAQTMGLLRGQQQASGNLERDLMIENVQETQRRKEAFSNLIRQTENARTDRSLAGQQLYGGMLSGEEAARTGREMYNATTGTNEALTQAGLTMGGLGTFTGTQAGQQAADLAQRQLEFLAESQRRQDELANRYLQRMQGGSTGGSVAV